MTKTFCDRCNEEIPVGEIVDVAIEKPVTLYMVGSLTEAKHQLCQKCAADLEQFLKGACFTPACYQPDGDGCAYQCYDGQDEPIEKCKECPLCYSDKQRRGPERKEFSIDEPFMPYEIVQTVRNNAENLFFACKPIDPYEIGNLLGEPVIVETDMREHFFGIVGASDTEYGVVDNEKRFWSVKNYYGMEGALGCRVKWRAYRLFLPGKAKK